MSNLIFKNEILKASMLKIIVTVSSGVLISLHIACKPPGNSSKGKNVQSLEAGEQTSKVVQVCKAGSSEKINLETVNVYFPDLNGTISPEIVASAKDALQTSLLASPRVFRAMFLGSANGTGASKGGGVLRVYNGTAEQNKISDAACKGDGGKGQPTSCWGFDEATKQPMISVFANGEYSLNPENVKPLLYSNVIVVLTMMYDQHFIKLFENALSEPAKEGAKGEEEKSSKLMLERAGKLKEFKDGLVKKFEEELVELGSEEVQKNLEGFKSNQEKFSGFVLAQLMDAYHCSDETKNDFKTKYDATFKFFEENIEGTGLKLK